MTRSASTDRFVVYVDRPEGRRYVSSIVERDCLTAHLYIALHLPKERAERLAERLGGGWEDSALAPRTDVDPPRA